MTEACAAFRRSSLAVGSYHTCGIIKADDSARCWGGKGEDYDYGQTTVPAISGGWASLAAGVFHTCGIVKFDNSTHCWGNNEAGQTDVPKP